MTDLDRERRHSSLVVHLRGAQQRPQLRQPALCHKMDPGDGKRLARGLDVSIGEGQRLPALAQEERV